MIAVLVAAALLTLVILGLLLFPLLRRPGALTERGTFDRAVYGDQLQELERDLGRGLIAETEAKAARLEIQRRVLATDTKAAIAPQRRSPLVAVAVAVLVVVAAGGLYARLGNPGIAALPAARSSAGVPPAEKAAAHVDMKDAAKRLQEKLATEPQNGEAWLLYARTESVIGDWDQAIDAYRHAIALGQTSADTYAGFGEMLVLAEQGIVSPGARDAFEAALKTQPKNDVARYYLALADNQAGEPKAAIAAWLALAVDIEDSSPMHAEIGRRVADAANSAGIPAPALPAGLPDGATEDAGPTPDQIQQAAEMAPAERDKMIDGMIAQLAEKLKAQPKDIDGWLRLGRAYAVRGQAAKADDAYDHAIALAPDAPEVKVQVVSGLLSGLQPSDPLPARAIDLLHQVAAKAPDEPEVLWYLGIVAARQGHADEARSDWSKLLAALPQNGEDYNTVKAALAELQAPK